MMPQRTPTHSFSARCPNLAMDAESQGRSDTAENARATAHSNAADEDNPAPTGTSPAITPSQPHSLWLACCKAQVTPLTYSSHPPTLRVRESSGKSNESVKSSEWTNTCRSARERRAIQTDLIWAGVFNGAASGSYGPLTFRAINALKAGKSAPDGVLAPAEREALGRAARAMRDAAGFKIVDDERTGVRIGIPQRVLPKREMTSSGGSRWQSADGKITLDASATPPGEDLAASFELEAQDPPALATQTSGFFFTGGKLSNQIILVAWHPAMLVMLFSIHSAVAGQRFIQPRKTSATGLELISRFYLSAL